MIGRLSGVVVEQGADGSVIFDVRGVGYEVFVPAGTVPRLGPAEVNGAPPASGGGRAREHVLHIHTHAREDALLLYGFATRADREAFRMLLTVTGVGPRLALAIIGALPADQLARVVARKERAAFKGISGVGRKLSERILLDLEGKLAPAVGGSSADAPAPITPPPAPTTEGEQVVGLLVQMGYRRGEAERAVQSLAVDAAAAEARGVERLLRDALGSLS
ncbi:MAG: Holliday junction branch migration protein RuvA [Myxococcales bacterium]|nr:Holliday junction branch migration protein RuvA [Myxococcales bacterium]